MKYLIQLLVILLIACKKPDHARFKTGEQVQFKPKETTFRHGRIPFTIKGVYYYDPEENMNYYIIKDADSIRQDNVQDDILEYYKP